MSVFGSRLIAYDFAQTPVSSGNSSPFTGNASGPLLTNPDTLPPTTIPNHARTSAGVCNDDGTVLSYTLNTRDVLTLPASYDHARLAICSMQKKFGIIETR